MSVVKFEIENVTLAFTSIENVGSCELELASKQNPKIYPKDHRKFEELNLGYTYGRLGVVKVVFDNRAEEPWYAFVLKPTFASAAPDEKYYLFYCPPGIIKAEGNPSVLRTEGELFDTLSKGRQNQGKCS